MVRHMNRRFLFSCIVWLAACPLWGQATFVLKGHLKDDRLILEMDKQLMDVPMLLVRHEIGFHQVTWSKEGRHLLLYMGLVPSEVGIQVPPLFTNQRIERQLLGRFPILEGNPDESTISIDATDLFVKTYIRWNIQSQETIKGNLTFIKAVEHREAEVIVRTVRTMERQGDNSTENADFSLYLLPDPMRPRLFDHRMGYESEGTFSSINWATKSEKGSSTRWRLVKKDMKSVISPPIKPIVLYLDPKIPDKWKPYVRSGIEEWLPAFKEAGFSNAIEVRELEKGTKEDFGQQMGISMVHWVDKSHIRGKEGGGSNCQKVTDFRTGEILKADIYLTNPMGLAQDYFVRCAPLDKRAQRFPFPDDLMGRLIQSVTAHETGHALGLRDGNYGEYAYPFVRMRDTQWLQRMSHVPSIMSYSRHHHIAQPEDGISTDLLLQRVGPMDLYQIKWGYTPIPDAKDPWEELPYLERLIRVQDSVPWFRFTVKINPPLGPGGTEEVADNNDPIQSMALGLKNLERVMDIIPETTQGPRDDGLLEQLHEKTLEFWYKQMYHVLSMVGGYSMQYKDGNQNGPLFVPIAMEEQLQALDFLLENGFKAPKWISKPSYEERLHNSEDKNLLLGNQLRLLKDLMEPARWKRMEFMEEGHGFEGLTELMMSKIQEGLFEELEQQEVIVEKHRQALQMGYVMEMETALQTKRDLVRGLSGYNRYQQGQYVLGGIRSKKPLLLKKILKGLDHSQHPSTQGHLMMCRDYLCNAPIEE